MHLQQSLLSSTNSLHSSQSSASKQPLLQLPSTAPPSPHQRAKKTRHFRYFIEIALATYLIFTMYLILCTQPKIENIYKIVGYGVACVVLLRIYLIIIKQQSIQQLRNQLIIIKLTVVVLFGFFAFSAVYQATGDYHYVLCGFNTFIFAYCIYLHAKDLLLIHFSPIFLIVYYILRQCQYASKAELYTEQHTGIGIVLTSLVLIVYASFVIFSIMSMDKYQNKFIEQEVCFSMYAISYFLYFGILVLLGIANKVMPYWIVAIFVQVFFALFLISCIFKFVELNNKFRWFIKPMFVLQTVKNNTLKLAEDPSNSSNPNPSEQYQKRQFQAHKCIICKNQTALYAQQCTNDTFYFFLCWRQECKEQWLGFTKDGKEFQKKQNDQRKKSYGYGSSKNYYVNNNGKCFICKERKAKIYRVVFLRGRWEVVQELIVNVLK